MLLQNNRDYYVICQIPFNNPSNSRFGFGSHDYYFAMSFGKYTGQENRPLPQTLVDYDFHTWYYNNAYIEITDLNINKFITNASYVSGQKIGIFNGISSISGGAVKGKIKSYIHKRNGQEILNLVPCYRKSDNEIGMYDLVTNTFFTNSGSGTFTKGNDV